MLKPVDTLRMVRAELMAGQTNVLIGLGRSALLFLILSTHQGRNGSLAKKIWKPNGTWVSTEQEPPYATTQTKWQCANDRSWKYSWVQSMDPKHKLHTGRELCDIVPAGAQIFIIGDSLTGQLHWSWADRLNHSGELNSISWPGPMHAACCRNGACLIHVYAALSVVEPRGRCSFTSEKEVLRKCARAVCAVDTNYLVRLQEQLFQNASVVIMNDWAHLHRAIKLVRSCYSKVAIDTDSWYDATMDVLRWWRSQAAMKASALRSLTSARIFYRTSPPSAEWFMNKQKRKQFPIEHPCGVQEVQERKNRILEMELIAHPDVAYSHATWAIVNNFTSDMYLKAGHEVIDLAEMLGVRVDAHKGSWNGKGDLLHFCMPGAPDYALDAIVDIIFGS
jgi:hypothetical protein